MLKWFSSWPLIRQLLSLSDGTGLEAASARSIALRSRSADADVTAVVCPFCSVGCGQLVHHRHGRLIAIEGNPDSPINEGTLCATGFAGFESQTRPTRLQRVLYRGSRSNAWETIALDRAIDIVAERIWETRRATFVGERDGVRWNHTAGMAMLAGDGLSNESLYLTKKLFTAGLGMIHAGWANVLNTPSTTCLEREAVTTSLDELSNADCIVILGSTPAEQHPIAFWRVMQARERGATVVHVDPQFTRTGAAASLWVAIRVDRELAFLGGLVRHVLAHESTDDASRAVAEPRFDQYTPEFVQQTAGVPPDLLHQVARALLANSGSDKRIVFCCADRWARTSNGEQTLRAVLVLQRLLGIVGRSGVVVLRDTASQQGAIDLAAGDKLPGNLPLPRIGAKDDKLSARAVSLLKAFYGTHATAENDWGWEWIPRVAPSPCHDWRRELADGSIEGLLIAGQSGGLDGSLDRGDLAKLKWLVVHDDSETDVAAFWKTADDNETEVFLFPAARYVEQAGSFTNSNGSLQWSDKALNPPGEARSMGWLMHQLAKRMKVKANASTNSIDAAMRALAWTYPEVAASGGEPDPQAVHAEISGCHIDSDGTRSAPLSDARDLKADGSTACGCWTYAGTFGTRGIASDHRNGNSQRSASHRTMETPLPDSIAESPTEPDSKYPFGLLTHRSNASSAARSLELSPESFAEMSHELAESIGVKHLDLVDLDTLVGSN
ncbi:MAG: molybdopterin-dependent oxidoreductase, partial [Planctomycetota bacterium]|nr:molybdopterin-dependent oxidoreductase [Planctomycetota bacterium]